jgi:hypothetical protein
LHGPILLKRRLACISVREMQRGEADDLRPGRQGHSSHFSGSQSTQAPIAAVTAYINLAAHPWWNDRAEVAGRVACGDD